VSSAQHGTKRTKCVSCEFIFNSLLFFSHLVSQKILFVTVLSSDILTTRPTYSNPLAFVVVTVFGFLYITCNSSLVWILQIFWSFIGQFILVFSAPLF